MEAQAGIQDTAKQIGVYNTSSWCSADPTNDFAVQIRDKTYDVGISLRDAALKVESTVEGVQSDMHQILDKVDQVDKNLKEINAYMTIAKIVVIFIIIIVLCLMLACVLAWIDKLHMVPVLMGNSFVFPTLTLLLILFWCFTALSLIGAMAGSDYCTMPDEITVNILVTQRETLSPMMFLLLIYYVTGCLPDRTPTDLDEFSTALAAVGNSVHTITSEVTSAITSSNLAAQCGGDGANQLTELLGLVDASVHEVFNSLGDVRGMMQCENWNPIYTTFAYEGKISLALLPEFRFILLTSCHVLFHLRSILRKRHWGYILGVLHSIEHGSIRHANDHVTSGSCSILKTREYCVHLCKRNINLDRMRACSNNHGHYHSISKYLYRSINRSRLTCFVI